MCISWLFVFQYNRVINDMLAIFNSATICAYNDPLNCDLRLEPGKLFPNIYIIVYLFSHVASLGHTEVLNPIKKRRNEKDVPILTHVVNVVEFFFV